ncbi:Gfo/Idh/MocA family protein [candidate division KSB1 bacterium]
MGMIGGGKDAFIGAVHRMAASMDGECELVCGAFSSTSEKSKESGASLYLPPDRVYGDFEEMIARERELPEGDRMDFVSIVTPNHLHYQAARLALESGFPVVCEKPMAYTLQQAKDLAAVVEKTGLLFALTHNYTGYPLVKEAREMVRDGKIGSIRKVVVEYPQGWLATKLEDTGQKQAVWRTDPEQAGASNCIGDIGTHAENLAEYITGLRITELCADLTRFGEGRTLDDDGNVLLRFDNGARGLLHASQISVGEENNLKIHIYGEVGGLEWAQQEPNTLLVKWTDRPMEVFRTGGNLSGRASWSTRLPAGHPEGYVEAFANVYLAFLLALRARLEGGEPEHLDFPTAADGVRGLAFIETVVESSASETKWTRFKS